MRDPLRLSLLFVALAWGGSSCMDNGLSKKKSSPSSPFLDAGGIDAAGLCPAEAPRVGEPCAEEFDPEGRCEYENGSCVIRLVEYPINEEYCCPRGTWALCRRFSPCLFDAYVPPLDAGHPDRASEAGQGAEAAGPPDAPSEAGPDAGVPDAPVDAAPDAPEGDSPPEADAATD